ncbi:hypothetical protein CKF48_08385 [Cytobacillus kochii]|uniref:Uncharacterized protein n=1 Tax=Cytobacillus kochii TaxID=859143 RepID=A0A248TGK9_9BACI|nr:hypothetical protein CKF48_08385 [Cytobacillus kochii]
MEEYNLFLLKVVFFLLLKKGVGHKKLMFQIQFMKKQPLCWHTQKLITDRWFRVEFVYYK